MMCIFIGMVVITVICFIVFNEISIYKLKKEHKKIMEPVDKFLEKTIKYDHF